MLLWQESLHWVNSQHSLCSMRIMRSPHSWESWDYRRAVSLSCVSCLVLEDNSHSKFLVYMVQEWSMDRGAWVPSERGRPYWILRCSNRIHPRALTHKHSIGRPEKLRVFRMDNSSSNVMELETEWGGVGTHLCGASISRPTPVSTACYSLAPGRPAEAVQGSGWIQCWKPHSQCLL